MVISIDQRRQAGALDHLRTVAPDYTVHILPEPVLAADVVWETDYARRPGYALTRGEVACFLSHRKAWRYAAALLAVDPAATVTVMEDDARVEAQSMAEATRVFDRRSTDVLFMGLNPLVAQCVPHDVDVDRISGYCWGAFAYRASRRFYQVAGGLKTPVSVPVDIYLTALTWIPHRFVQRNWPAKHIAQGPSTTYASPQPHVDATHPVHQPPVSPPSR